MAKNTQISVIVLSYNTKEITLNCLDKLKRSIEYAKLHVETIVVENGSDGTASELKRNYKWVKLIEPKTNTGFTKGNNLALKHISDKSKFVLFLNSDAYLKKDTIAKALSFFEEYKTCDVVGCRLNFADGHLQPSAGFLPTPFSVFNWIWGIDLVPSVNNFLKSVHVRDPNFFSKSKKVDWVMGAFMLMKKEVIEKTVGFNENFFMYMEEVEWFKRIKDAGFEVWYTPQFSVTHLDQMSSKGTDAKIKIFKGEMLGLAYYIKNYYPNSFGIVSILMKLGLLLRASTFFVLGNQIRTKAYFQTFKELV